MSEQRISDEKLAAILSAYDGTLERDEVDLIYTSRDLACDLRDARRELAEARALIKRMAAERNELVTERDKLAEYTLTLADERDAAIAERDKIKADHDGLVRAVNESADDCTPECDRYGHRDGCKTHSPATWVIALQAERDKIATERLEYAKALLRRESAMTGVIPADRDTVARARKLVEGK